MTADKTILRLEARLVVLCIAIAAIVVMTSCRRPQPAPLPLEHRIGWIHSNCLAIDNGMLEAGSPATVVSFGDQQSIVEARIGAKTVSAEQCPPLLEDRQAANAEKGMSFYQIATTDSQPIELGIAIIGAASRTGSGIDIDGDGKADHFTQCATTEGISFGVWNIAPYKGTALWSGYYYLGYDTERTCPV